MEEQRRTSLRKAVKGHGANDWQASGAVVRARGGEQGPGALLAYVLAATMSSQVPALRCDRRPCETCRTPESESARSSQGSSVYGALAPQMLCSLAPAIC